MTRLNKIDALGLSGPTYWYNPFSWYNSGPTWTDTAGGLHYDKPPSEWPKPSDQRPPITFAEYHDLLLDDDGAARFLALKQNVYDTATFIIELTPQNTISVVALGESLGGEKVGLAGRAQCAALSGPGVAYIGGKFFKVSGTVLKKLRGKSAREAEMILGKECCIAATKPVNLPSWKKVAIDMEEVISGHTSSGYRAIQSGRKDLFPDYMTRDQIERAIRQAYRNGEKVLSQGDRILVRGPFDDEKKKGSVLEF
jgi:hypothetical protein